MLDVAKYLFYSKSIDVSPEKDRFFNLSMANTGQLFACLHEDKSQGDLSPSCKRAPAVKDRLSNLRKET
jgi:RecB family exonuclease